jgi:amino acid adenylation domain-containing protein
LAAWKVGGRLLPLEATDPQERLETLVQSARVSLVVNDEEDGEILSEPVPHVSVTAKNHGGRTLDERPVSAEDGAYIIFTSGSTGAPKGVLVRHSSLTHLVDAAGSCVGVRDGDVWSCVHSFAFDFSVWEIFGPLLSGGSVVILPRTTVRDPVELVKALITHDVTVLSMTPQAFYSVIDMVTAEPAARRLAGSLRRVVLGGDKLEVQRLDSWFTLFRDDGPHIVNMYGITETTVHASHRQIVRSDLNAQRRSSPIGGPLPGYRFHVLDKSLKPARYGEPGELYVGGSGVAEGYIGEPRRTAAAFTPEPGSPSPGLRNYRTGDLVVQRSEFEYEYLGRVDHQMKVRGFRVEPGEIEAVLARHAAVRNCAVGLRRIGANDTLVAYIVLDRPISDAELASHVAASCPSHMIPSLFKRLPTLPITTNGKVDRTILAREPVGSEGRPLDMMPSTAERRHVMEAVRSAWATVLGRDDFGADESFFLIGGHSMMGAKMIATLNKKLGVGLPLRLLFDHPTVADLAAAAQAEVAERPSGQSGA